MIKIRQTNRFYILAVFTLACVLILVAGGTASAVISAPVSYWPANGSSVDAADGNDGTLVNGATFGPGRLGQAFSLDGQDDYIQIGDKDNLRMSDYVSIAAWVHPTGPGSGLYGSGGIIVNKEGEYQVARFSDGTIKWCYADAPGSWNWRSTNYEVLQDKWTHIALVYNRGVVKTYANGVWVHTYNPGSIRTIGDTSTSMNDFRIGGRQWSDIPTAFPQVFEGQIDEVRVYNVALSAAEVLDLYSMVLEVNIDIKPDSCPNPLNIKSNGVLPVAILGTAEFDATQVDPASVMLEEVAPLRSHLKDVAEPDGFMDMVFNFDTQEVVAALGYVYDRQELALLLTGNMMEEYGGAPISGQDVVVVMIGGDMGDMSLNLYDDDFQEVALGFTFPYQGQEWNSVWVNSNGSLTFGSGDWRWWAEISDFLDGQPRIAPLWADLNPEAGGQILVKRSKHSITIRFIKVPEYGLGGENTFSVEMRHKGDIRIVYGTVTADFPEPDNTCGLTGITEGGGIADPGETDLSAAKRLLASGTTYEQFMGSGSGDSFDLENTTIIFHPED